MTASALKKLNDLMKSDEELHRELQPFVDLDGGFPMLKHPLVFMVPYFPQYAAMANEMLRNKQAMIREYKAKREWHGYVWAHERPYRFEAAVVASCRISDPSTIAKLFGKVWIDSENIWQNQDHWCDQIESMWMCEHSDHFMDEKDRGMLAAMPEEFVVWRGACRGENECGLSWTVDREKAAWFSTRLRDEDDAVLLEMTVKSSDVFAYMTGRGESEIIILPEKMYACDYREVEP